MTELSNFLMEEDLSILDVRSEISEEDSEARNTLGSNEEAETGQSRSAF